MSKIKFQGNASGTGVLTITSPNTNADRTITLPDEDVTLGGGVDGIVSNADATAITIDSSEQVGIGETTPDRTLHIQGTAKIRNASTSYLDMYCSGGGNRDWQVGVNGANFVINDVTSGTSEKLRIQSGGGISFNGDTASANALNDYEEGTFTVTMGTGGGSITLNSSQNLLVYTKIGNLVSIGGRVLVSSVSSPSGEISINGLPFSAAHGSGEGTNHQNMSVHFRNAASDVGGVTGQTSSTNIHIYEAGTTGNTNVGDKIQANTYIMIGGVYRTAS